MISENSNKAVVGRHFHSFKKNIKIYLIVLIVMALICGLIFYLMKYSHKTDKSNSNSVAVEVCSRSNNISLLKQAVPYLNPSQPIKLYPIVNKIKNLPNYTKDPNCDYVLVNYWLNYNPKNSKTYLNYLKNYVTNDYVYNSAIASKTVKLDTLNHQYDNLVTAVNSIYKNTNFVRSPAK